MDQTTTPTLSWLKASTMIDEAADAWQSEAGPSTKARHNADRDDLRAISEAVAHGKLAYAMQLAENLDTIVRDQIPPAVWTLMGGKLIAG
jgi:hypothetical protein